MWISHQTKQNHSVETANAELIPLKTVAISPLSFPYQASRIAGHGELNEEKGLICWLDVSQGKSAKA